MIQLQSIKTMLFPNYFIGGLAFILFLINLGLWWR